VLRVLVGFDGSPSARRALDRAVARVRDGHGDLLVVSVIPEGARRSSIARMMPAGVELPPPLAGTFEEHTVARLEAVVEAARKAGVEARSELRVGEPVEAILAAALAFKADEILLGAKSYEGPEAEVGPNASEIAARSKIPVTLVP
jgi:nucleotide-binding universal stress UspA family protein